MRCNRVLSLDVLSHGGSPNCNFQELLARITGYEHQLIGKGSKIDHMHFFEFLSARSFTLIRKSSLVAIITFCLATVCLASAATAQTTTTITGTAQDTVGATLAGVKVTARHIDTGLSLSVVTAEDGRYVFPAMPVGNYEIRADLSGFRPLVRQGIRLVVGETAIVDLTLRSGRA